MKVTMDVDDKLLTRAMAALGAKTRTAAVDLALREVVRKGELVRLAEEGLGMSSKELAGVFDPDYDLAAFRVAENPSAYGVKKSGPGR